MMYITFAAEQTIVILLSSVILWIVSAAFVLFEYPARNNSLICKIIDFVSVFLQSYILICVLMVNTHLMHSYYASAKGSASFVLMISITIVIHLIFLFSSASSKRKDTADYDYESRNHIAGTFANSVLCSIPLYALLLIFPDLIWSFPGTVIYKFVLWIEDIKVIGSVFSFAMNGISLLLLSKWTFSAVVMAPVLIVAIGNGICKIFKQSR